MILTSAPVSSIDYPFSLSLCDQVDRFVLPKSEVPGVSPLISLCGIVSMISREGRRMGGKDFREAVDGEVPGGRLEPAVEPTRRR